MTRLTSEIVIPLISELDRYDRELNKKTGKNLKQIAAESVGIDVAEIDDIASSISAAVIPITADGGVIDGFVDAVRAIISHMGFNAFVTKQKDVSGLAEGVERGAKIVLLADDNRFIAVNLKECFVADNSESTGKGFVTALKLMAEDLKERKVLVIGAGKVGLSAMSRLKEYKAAIAVYDIDISKAEKASELFGTVILKDLNDVFRHYQLIIDASPAKGILKKEHITPYTMIAACGLPLILDTEALKLVKERLVHDPLQIGVATMFFSALFCR
ncbi:MAG: 3-methylornithyl-N6-L-lysine dehydrogenase PylD [Spirochaetota bacterium]|nr:MAG: 3-methylornithyl-N6-L-lysine dehydrogenase PylD [Spirochaetota bacterium]